MSDTIHRNDNRKFEVVYNHMSVVNTHSVETLYEGPLLQLLMAVFRKSTFFIIAHLTLECRISRMWLVTVVDIYSVLQSGVFHMRNPRNSRESYGIVICYLLICNVITLFHIFLYQWRDFFTLLIFRARSSEVSHQTIYYNHFVWLVQKLEVFFYDLTYI